MKSAGKWNENEIKFDFAGLLAEAVVAALTEQTHVRIFNEVNNEAESIVCGFPCELQ